MNAPIYIERTTLLFYVALCLTMSGAIFIPWLIRFTRFDALSANRSFESDFDIDESAQRIAMSCRPAYMEAPFSRHLLGSAAPDSVILSCRTKNQTNSFKPVFTGHFENDAGKTMLRSEYAMALASRVFMAFWLTAVGAVILGVAALEISGKMAYQLQPFVFMFALLGGGIWLVVFGKKMAADDIHWLSANIKALLKPGEALRDDTTP